MITKGANVGRALLSANTERCEQNMGLPLRATSVKTPGNLAFPGAGKHDDDCALLRHFERRFQLEGQR